jgi:hypothetical protein
MGWFARFGIFFQALDADALSRTLGTFALGEGTPQHLAIDGKTLRGSRRLEAKAVHVRSGFATALGAVIGEMVVKTRSERDRGRCGLAKGHSTSQREKHAL